MKKWLIIFLLIPTLAEAKITLNSAPSANAGFNTANASFDYTVNIGTNTLLVVGISNSDTGCSDVTGVDAEGNAMTKAVEASSTNIAEIWYLVAPPTGTVTITLAQASTCRQVINAIAFDGVNQTTPIYDTATSTNSSSNADTGKLELDTAGCGWLFDVFSNADVESSGHTPEIIATENWDTNNTNMSGASQRWEDLPLQRSPYTNEFFAENVYQMRYYSTTFSFTFAHAGISINPDTAGLNCGAPLRSSTSTWYVRSDGNNSTCSGLVDAAAAAAPDCAKADMYGLYPNQGAPTARAGDTIILRSTDEFEMGHDKATSSSECDETFPYSCTISEIYGLFPEQPTKIYGSNYTSCPSNPSDKAQLYGTYRLDHVLPLGSHTDTRCLDITNHDGCIQSGVFDFEDDVRCQRTCSSLSNCEGSDDGILINRRSYNVKIKDVDVHGHGYGIHVENRLYDFILDNVKLIANAWGGIEFEFNTPGLNYLVNTTISWNGCGERYPRTPGADLRLETDKHHCAEQGQNASQSADGIAWDGANESPDDIGTIYINGMECNHNTADCFDALHAAATLRNVYVVNSEFDGNNGQALKVTNNTYVWNDFVSGRCDFFNGKSYTASSTIHTTSGACSGNGTWDGNECDKGFDTCRATGTPMTMNFKSGMIVDIRGATFAPLNGDVVFQISNTTCDGTEIFNIYNSIFEGGNDLGGGGGDKTDLMFCEGGSCCTGSTNVLSHFQTSGNFYESDTFTTTETGFSDTDDLFSNKFDRSTTGFDTTPYLSDTSAAINSGTWTLATPNDFFSIPRANPPESGAIEYKPQYKHLIGTIYDF